FFKSDDSPIVHWSKAQKRPSCCITSTTFESPMRTPQRRSRITWGALVMLSMPPATTNWASPRRMARSARAMADIPERHTLLMVVQGTVMGRPPATAAWREVIWPSPAWRTWPNRTSSTEAGSTPDRCTAPAMAAPPRSTARLERNTPLYLPIGVRAMPVMTVIGSQGTRVLPDAHVADPPTPAFGGGTFPQPSGRGTDPGGCGRIAVERVLGTR